MKNENNISAKINMEIAREIRTMRKRRIKIKDIKRYLNINISEGQISKITKNKYWKEEDELV